MPKAALSSASLDEQEAVRRARDGDDAAFATLVDKYSRAMVDYCRRLVGDAVAAEDLAQETFVKLYLALPSFELGRPLPPFLYRIAHNHCLDYLRKKKTPTVSLTVEDEESGEETVLDVADSRLAPDELAGRAEVQAAIDAALAAMPPTYRGALIMRYREGLSYEDIAAALALPLGTVKAHIHRGRQKLQQMLAPYV